MIQSNLIILFRKNLIKSPIFNKNKRHYSSNSNNPTPDNSMLTFMMLGTVGILSIINRKGPGSNGPCLPMVH
jgi:hypothetical protein